MTTDFAEYHAELEAVAREVLAPAGPLSGGGPTAGGSGALADWDLLARSGWLGLEVPEALDGSGATYAEVAVVLRAMGAAVTRSAYLGSAVLGVGALNMVEPGEARDSLLKAAASGELRLAVALSSDDQAGTSPFAAPFTAERSGSGVRLHGSVSFVADAAGADRVLLPALEGGQPVLVAVDPATVGVVVQTVAVTDPTRSVATVTADAAEVAPEAVWPLAGSAEEAFRPLYYRAAAALACDSLGLAEAVMEATVDYAGNRHQFGRAIGSFQAVKHACADMLVQVSVGRELLAEAVAAVAEQTTESWAAVARAKSYVCDAAVAVGGKAIQMHGGIGYTWESGLHFYLKRAMFNRSWFGSSGWHRRSLAGRYG